MHFSKIPALEALIKSGKGGFTVKENAHGHMSVTKPDARSFYYNEPLPKERIVLHFTVGNLRGDLSTLLKPSFVSVPYVIARDGTIYELWNPECWAYHLGIGAFGGNKFESRKTIGIELSNYGPLRLEGDELHTAYSVVYRKDVYCNLSDVGQYIKLASPFRGHMYYADYTDTQIQSLIGLIRHLTKRFGIDRSFLPEHTRYLARRQILDHSGIVSHINYRDTGKWDIGPAFDWDYVIDKVTDV